MYKNRRANAEQWTNIARGKERKGHLTAEIPTDDIGKVYEKAGDYWLKVRDDNSIKNAIKCYKSSLEYHLASENLKRVRSKLEKLGKLKEKGKLKISGLERLMRFSHLQYPYTLPLILAISGFVLSLIFISFSLTGYAIGNLTSNVSRGVSILLF